VFQRTNVVDGDADQVSLLQRERRIGHDAGTRHQQHAGRETALAEQVAHQVLETALDSVHLHAALVDRHTFAQYGQVDARITREDALADQHTGAHRRAAVPDLGLWQVERVLALDAARRWAP